MRVGRAQPRVEWDRFPAVSSAVEPMLEDAVEKTARDLEAHAMMNAPYETGQLSGSGDVLEAGKLVREVAFTAEHAVYQEFGTMSEGASSPYPWDVDVSYSSRPGGIRATAFLGRPAKDLEAPFQAACEQALQRAGRAR